MRKNILILEDVETAREALAQIVKSCDEEIEVFTFSNVGDACACMMENKIDLFLIDIILQPQVSNDFSGITFAEYVRKHDQYLAADIVFVTTLIGLEAELLRRIHCFDYIEKPIRESRVRQVVLQAIQKIEKKVVEDAICFVRKDRVSYAIHENEIMLLESHHKTLSIHKIDDTLEIPNLSMNQFIKRLQTQHFLIPTKGTAVNYAFIEYVDPVNRYVKMRGQKELIEIGAKMKKQFMREIEELQGVRK